MLQLQSICFLPRDGKLPLALCLSLLELSPPLDEPLVPAFAEAELSFQFQLLLQLFRLLHDVSPFGIWVVLYIGP